MGHSIHAWTLLCAVLLSMGVGRIDAAAENRPAPDRQTGIIRGRGALEPTGYEELRCRTVQPRAVLFAVAPGAAVKEGDLLIELDSYGLMEQTDEQSIRLEKAQADLRELEASLPGAKQVAADAVAIAEKAIGMAQRRLEAYRKTEYRARRDELTNQVTLAEERVTALEEHARTLEAAFEEKKASPSLRELQEALFAWHQAKVDLTLAASRLEVFEEVHHPQRTEELGLAVAQKELDLLRARNELEQTTRQGETAHKLATLTVRAERRRLEHLMREIEACKVLAPRNGTVFPARDASQGGDAEAVIRPGATVHPNQMLLRIADLTQLKLAAQIRASFSHP